VRTLAPFLLVEGQAIISDGEGFRSGLLCCSNAWCSETAKRLGCRRPITKIISVHRGNDGFFVWGRTWYDRFIAGEMLELAS
jgi:hypothetical protein